eukprot:TRINITY_DN33976_c0_g1_i1.p1 TRINITY_DN33976_c0_g1~~TRINITY_DN33976_c0_g1_i1.p1  ORF type:complete len:671 (-),score=72.42 TRINITY_DN33976_c0_g1_i1:306-2318(-)
MVSRPILPQVSQHGLGLTSPMIELLPGKGAQLPDSLGSALRWQAGEASRSSRGSIAVAASATGGSSSSAPTRSLAAASVVAASLGVASQRRWRRGWLRQLRRLGRSGVRDVHARLRVRSLVACCANAGSEADVGTKKEIETDVVIIGSGLGGLSCGGVLATAGRKVLVCESHYRPGGACHTFSEDVKDIGKFMFESGPSLYSGLSDAASPSQLKHVFQIVGEEPEWITYDRWNAFLPEGEVNVAVGYKAVVEDLLPKYGGPTAVQEWQKVMKALKPYSEVVYNSPPFCAIREDPWAVVSLGRYWNRVKPIPGGPEKLVEPFSKFLDAAGSDDEFIRNYLSMFCFLLQGLPSYGAPTSMMAYMMADLYRRGGTRLDYPRGGSEAIIQCLLRGITKHEGCEVKLRSHVEQILVEDGRACGVRLRDGTVVRAKEVVSNADIRLTHKLVGAGVCPALDNHIEEQWKPFEPLNSFIHIHLGFRGDGLPKAHCPEFPAQWGVVNDWSDLEAPRNMVLVSVASLLDPECAPEGYHSLHAYTPATERFADWEGMDRSSEEYKRKKAEAADFLYSAIERQIPDIRKRVVFEKVGTPLTHERFLRKPGGAYGWRVTAGKDLPGHTTPLPGLHVCGDSTYPGIGVPAAAMGGHICANNLLSIQEHWEQLDRVPLWDYELEM